MKMKKLLGLSVLLLCIFSTALNAQTHADSIKKAVRKDVKKFKLSKGNFKIFKKGGISEKSDLFKPDVNVSKSSFLTDTAYVNAYSAAAYRKTVKRKANGHYLLIVGTGVVLAPVVLIILLNNAFPK